MPSPRTEKQVRGFLGRLNYISRFIYLMTATCASTFKLLWKNQSCVWTDDCQKAHDSFMPRSAISTKNEESFQQKGSTSHNQRRRPCTKKDSIFSHRFEREIDSQL